MAEKGFTDFIRRLFESKNVLSVQEIYGHVLDTYPNYLTDAVEYQHRVRSTLYSLKKNGEIISVDKGTYKKSSFDKSAQLFHS